jgi:hypothetical protein
LELRLDKGTSRFIGRIVDGEDHREEQVERKANQRVFGGRVVFRNQEKQTARDRQEDGREQDVRPRLALFGLGAVDEVAEQEVEEHHHDAADQREIEQEFFVEVAQFEDIGVVDVEPRADQEVEQLGPDRAQEVAEDLFLLVGERRPAFRIEDLPVQQMLFSHKWPPI